MENFKREMFIINMLSPSSKIKICFKTKPIFLYFYRTPAYRDQTVAYDVGVFFELYRPSDGAFSEPKAFRYKPSEDVR